MFYLNLRNAEKLENHAFVVVNKVQPKNAATEIRKRGYAGHNLNKTLNLNIYIFVLILRF